MAGRFESSSGDSPDPVYLADGCVQVRNEVFDAVSTGNGFQLASGRG